MGSLATCEAARRNSPCWGICTDVPRRVALEGWFQLMLGDKSALDVAVAGTLLDLTALGCRSSSAMFHTGGWVCSSL